MFVNLYCLLTTDSSVNYRIYYTLVSNDAVNDFDVSYFDTSILKLGTPLYMPVHQTSASAKVNMDEF